MVGTLELEARMQIVKRGSPKLDAEIARVIRPDAELFFDSREPYWEPLDAPDPERVPRFSRSIDAKLPWENIVEIEACKGSSSIWRAVQQGNIEAIANTEALARRLAAIREIRQPEIIKPIKPVGDPGPLLSLFMLRCIEDLEMSAITAGVFRKAVGFFIEVNGDRPVAHYGRAHVWTFLRTIRQKPNGNNIAYRNLSLRRVHVGGQPARSQIKVGLVSLDKCPTIS